MLKNRSTTGALTPSNKVIALLAVSLLSTLLTTASTWGQSSPIPGDRAIPDFEPVADRQFEIDGQIQGEAEIYVSERQVVYLVVVPGQPSGLLISPRGKSVQSVDLDKLSRLEKGRAHLEENATGDNLGEYQLEGKTIVFEFDGKTARLKPRPPLTGIQSNSAVGEYDAKYAHQAESYQLTKNRSLKSLPIDGENVRVRVYFGSWSEICEYLVPKIMKVEEEWKSSGARFEYYGLPQPLIEDAVAVAEGIRGVPTVVVYVNDQEVGRLTGRPLDNPEESLYQLLQERR